MKPTYVTFEQAKWLKEKGFKERPAHIKMDTEYIEGYSYDTDDREDYLKDTSFQFEDNICSHLYLKPEQHQVVEWLRVNHNIDLQPICHYGKLGRTYRMGLVFINKNNEVDTVFLRPIDEPFSFVEFLSPQEAYSEAFNYIRNNNLL